MKILKKILLIIAIVLAVIIVFGLFFINHIQKRAIPDYTTSIQLKGITEEVTIYRDTYAIPHIYAKNENDLYTAVGYVLAQDRLWQMDLLRRVTYGRLSEIFSDDYINIDLFLRSLRIPEKSKIVIDSCDDSVIKAVEAFTSGVNQFIQTHQKELPVEFAILGYKPELWEKVHTINLIGYMSWDLRNGWNAEPTIYEICKRIDSAKLSILIPDLSKQNSFIYPDFTISKNTTAYISGISNEFEKLEKLGLSVFFGSNNWALKGKKNVDNKTTLANDMHLGLSAPGIWFQMHQVVEGKLNVTGLVLPGQPFVICGHNDSIAWGMTNVMVDDVDFYLEKLNKDSTKYKFNGEWRDLKIVDEQIKSKSGEIFNKQIRYTHRGPIITDFKDILYEPVSIAWVGNYYSNELSSVYYLNRANNWDDFKDAMVTFNAISQNVIYADVNNNIGLYCCAGIPIRKGNGIFIAPGDTDLYDWKGLVPFDQLPHSYNPEKGYLVSANNRTANDDYPYYISHWFHLPSRYDRINNLFKAKDKLSIEDQIKIQNDLLSLYALNIKPKLIDPLNNIEGLSEKEQEIVGILNNWDGIYLKESIAPTLFEKLNSVLLKNALIDEIGDTLHKELLKEKTFVWNTELNLLDSRNSSWYDDIKTTEIKETFTDILKKSLTETIDELTNQFGDDINDWVWGNVHKLTLEHPLGSVNLLNKIFKFNRGAYPVGGSYHTVAPYSFTMGAENFNVIHGASERFIFVVNDWDKSISVIPTGNSGVPASKYYCDQTELYVNGKYHNDYFSVDNVIRNAKYIMTISNK